MLDRIVTRIAFVDDTYSPLVIVFDDEDIAGTNAVIISRYETEAYKNFINIMRDYYAKGYVDPNQRLVDEPEPNSFVSRRDAGEYFICTSSYYPKQEVLYMLRPDTHISRFTFVSRWASPIGFTEVANSSGLAVYSGTKYAP